MPKYGARLWLPVGRKPVVNPQTEREHLLNELYDLRYAIIGAGKMEIQELRDQVQACREKAAAAEEEQVKAGQALVAKMDPDQVKGALKDYINWRNRKQGKEAPYST